MQDTKNCHLSTIAQPCWAISLQLRHVLTIGKKLVKQSPTCSHSMMHFGPLAAESCWWVWGTPANFNGFCILAALLHGTLHCVPKNVPPLSCYNFYIHGSIATIFWQKCCRESSQLKHFIFPPHLTNASALPGETGNLEIASFHLNSACFLPKKQKTV